jgi:transposase InsO family protein
LGYGRDLGGLFRIRMMVVVPRPVILWIRARLSPAAAASRTASSRLPLSQWRSLSAALSWACGRLSIAQSMGRPGSALDNAVIESWHSTVEFELRRTEHFTTRAAARAKVAAWIEDYNTNRRHTACQKMPPAAYEQLLITKGKAA